MAFFFVEYGMIFLLLIVWIILAVLIVKFWSNRIVKTVGVLLFGLSVFSLYENFHIYNNYLQSSQERMMVIVGHLDSAVGLIERGDNVDAAIEVATAGGAMRALGTGTDGRMIYGNAAQLERLGETFEVQIAPSVAKSKSESTPEIKFVEYADKVFSEAKKHQHYPLSLLHSQLQNIVQHQPS